MARNKKKGTSGAQPEMLGATGAALDDDLLKVNLASPTQQLHQKSSKRRKAAVWTFIIVGVLTTANGIAMTVNPPIPETVASSVSSTDVNASLGKSVAHDKLQTWLAQTPSPLPGGYVVSWDGFEAIAGGKAESNTDTPANAAELHSFTLAAKVGNDATVFYEATVLVSVDKKLGALAAAEPSLLPRVPTSSQGWSSEVWAGYENGPVTESVTATATAWADAFTKSANDLRLYVGDEDPNHAYMPLLGARVLGTNVVESGFVEVEGEEVPKTVIARVELTLAWSAAADAKGSKVTYDVLIERADTASPKIVAWGPSGTGPELERFGNAVTGTTLTSTPNESVPTEPTPAPELPGTAPEGSEG
jgi:hypothetical protein